MWDAIYPYESGQPHSRLQAYATYDSPTDNLATRLNGFRVPAPEYCCSVRTMNGYEYVDDLRLSRLGVELPYDTEAQRRRLISFDEDLEVDGVSVHPFTLGETGYRPGSPVVPEWVMEFQPTFFVRRNRQGWLIDQLRDTDLRTATIDLRVDRLTSFAARNGWGYAIDPVVPGEPLATMVWA